eukprot:1587161-Rhodomonas_salina.1
MYPGTRTRTPGRLGTPETWQRYVLSQTQVATSRNSYLGLAKRKAERSVLPLDPQRFMLPHPLSA